MPDFHVFMALSLDGYIADSRGDVAWLNHADFDLPNEDFGFAAFMESVDAICMGRTTFEQLLSFQVWHYGDKPFYVATNRRLPALSESASHVRAIQGGPEQLAQELAARGHQHIYLDGGKLIQSFLAQQRIASMTLTHVPVVLGSGIPLFKEKLDPNVWDFANPQTYKNGFIQWRMEPFSP